MADILINMFENSIAVSVIILILFLFRPFLSKRYTAKWPYGVWLVVTVRLLVPFDIEIPNFTAPLNIPVENKVVYQADVAGETADDISTTPSAGEQSDNMPENTVTDNSLKEKVFDSAASLLLSLSIVLYAANPAKSKSEQKKNILQKNNFLLFQNKKQIQPFGCICFLWVFTKSFT